MKLGICEVVLDKRHFTDADLETIAEETLSVEPFGKIYTARVLPPLDKQGYGFYGDNDIVTHLLMTKGRHEHRIAQGADAIAYIAFRDNGQQKISLARMVIWSKRTLRSRTSLSLWIEANRQYCCA